MSREEEIIWLPGAGEGSCRIEVSGEHLELLGERAVWWCQRKILFVTDLHLGQTAPTRQGGLPGSTPKGCDSLLRLKKLVSKYSPTECIILGDLIDAKASFNERVQGELSEFFAQVAACRWRLIKGNHDRHTKHWPANWPLMIEGEEFFLPPFRLLHYPPTMAESTGRLDPQLDLISSDNCFFLAGHLHPAWRDEANKRVGEKSACYWLNARGLVLPAFGTYAKTQSIARQPGDRVFVIAANKVIEI